MVTVEFPILHELLVLGLVRYAEVIADGLDGNEHVLAFLPGKQLSAVERDGGLGMVSGVALRYHAHVTAPSSVPQT
ncbi:hypothetical protein [Deinococcus indicus]|uniref:hypothetical protein n=1 Tax=Deinococcus indicus TaxID=223556 RepID=UPI001E59C670|nr:hypothetical protein [Deinococcus indicus]